MFGEAFVGVVGCLGRVGGVETAEEDFFGGAGGDCCLLRGEEAVGADSAGYCVVEGCCAAGGLFGFWARWG